MMVPQDDLFSLRFLRAGKFDYDSGYRIAKAYYTAQQNWPELFISSSQYTQVFEANAMAVLPVRTATDEPIVVFLPARWDTAAMPFDTILAALVATVEQLLLSPTNQITGLVAVIDMSGVGWSQVKSFGPNQAKKMTQLIETALPIRVTQIHVINRSQLARLAAQAIKPFLSEELTSRSRLYSDLAAFHKQGIDRVRLPEELGGTDGPLDGKRWLKRLTNNERRATRYWVYSGFGLVPSDEDGSSELAGGEQPAAEGGVAGAAAGAGAFLSGGLGRLTSGNLMQKPSMDNFKVGMPSFSSLTSTLPSSLPSFFSQAKAKE